MSIFHVGDYSTFCKAQALNDMKYIITILFILLFILFSVVVARSFHNYEKLVFQAEFSSEYSNYPNKYDQQYGSMSVYAQGSVRSKQRPLRHAPDHVKFAVLSNHTNNPFRELYFDLYQSESLRKLKQCPFLALSFDLDNNSRTEEWVVTVSSQLCLHPINRYVDEYPHFWVIQKQAEDYRVLAEGDGKVRIRNNSQNYADIETEVHLKIAQPFNNLKCGGALLNWGYNRGAYQLKEYQYHTLGCDTLYYPNTHGKTHDKYREKYLEKVNFIVHQKIEQLFEEFK